MVVNLRSRRIAINCFYPDGTNALDISSAFIQLSLANSHLDESGLIKTTGTLVLAGRVPSFPESLNPLVNPRWGRGGIITVDIADNAGVMRRHPRGYLRILQTPAPTQEDLSIEVGCLLSALDFPIPANYHQLPLTPEELFDPSPRDAIINYLAARTPGIPSLVDEIADYPLTIDIVPPLDGKSRISQLGGIAYAAHHCLWADNLGQIRATKIDVDGAATFSRSVLSDAATWEYRQGDEVSAEVVRVSTLRTQRKIAIGDFSATTAISHSPDYSPLEVVTTIVSGATGTSPQFQQTRLAPVSVLFPEVRNNPSLITASQETKTDYFSTDDSGILLRTYQTVLEPRGITLPDYFSGDRNLAQAKTVEVVYTYDKEVPTQIASTTYEPLGKVSPEVPANEGQASELVPSSQEIQTWEKYANGWLHRQVRSDFRTNTVETITSISDTQNQPPAAQRRQYPTYKATSQSLYEARFSQRVGPTSDQRPIHYAIPPTVISDEQLQAHCYLLGKLLYGRAQPIAWECALPEAMLTAYQPLTRWDWQEPDGDINRYLVAAEAFEITPDSSSYAADGILLGTTPVGGTFIPPWVAYPQGAIAAKSTFNGTLHHVGPALAAGDMRSVSTLAGGAVSIASYLMQSVSTMEGSLLTTASITGAIASASAFAGSLLTTASITGAIEGVSTMEGTLTGGSSLPTTFRINVGGGDYTDGSSNLWIADDGTYFNSTNLGSHGNAVANTTDDTLYQTLRWSFGSIVATIPIANGVRDVTLKFTEDYFNSGGNRSIDIIINGSTVQLNFDVFNAAGGQFIAHDLTFSVTVSTEELVIELRPDFDTALLNAIEIT